VVASIRDVALSAPRGIDVLLFVMRHARITDDAIARLIYVTEYLWGKECLLNLYIVVTHASRFVVRPDEAEAWIERQAEMNWRFRHIYGLVGNNPNRFIFVDNPDPQSEEPNIEGRQAASRDALMKVLALHPRDVVPPFTHAMMKSAATKTEQEIRELEVRTKEENDLGREDSSEDPKEEVGRADADVSGPKRHKKAAKTPKAPQTEVDKTVANLREKRAQARRRREEAEQALRKKLEEVKASAEFQEEAASSAREATLRFAKTYEMQAEPGKTPQGGTVNPVAACKRMVGGLTQAFGRRLRSSTASTSSKQESPYVEPAPSAQPMDDVQSLQDMDIHVDNILATLRKTLKGSCRECFERYSGAAATLSPIGFQLFLAEVDPPIKGVSAGHLWRRGDKNCDGQLDFKEFQALFGGPSSSSHGSKKAPSGSDRT